MKLGNLLEGMTGGVGKNVVVGFTKWWDFILNSYPLSRMDSIGDGRLALCDNDSGGLMDNENYRSLLSNGIHLNY